MSYLVCNPPSTEIHLTDEFCLGPQDTEAAISFANWDVFWYTRGFPSMDTERSRRHASKLLTYPLTIGSVLHQHSGLTLSNQRVTPEGSRSLAGADGLVISQDIQRSNLSYL